MPSGIRHILHISIPESIFLDGFHSLIKMTNDYIPQETQNKMHLYSFVSNMKLTVTGIFEIESSH